MLFFGILHSLDDVGVSCLHPLIEEIEIVLTSGPAPRVVLVTLRVNRPETLNALVLIYHTVTHSLAFTFRVFESRDNADGGRGVECQLGLTPK